MTKIALYIFFVNIFSQKTYKKFIPANRKAGRLSIPAGKTAIDFPSKIMHNKSSFYYDLQKGFLCVTGIFYLTCTARLPISIPMNQRKRYGHPLPDGTGRMARSIPPGGSAAAIWSLRNRSGKMPDSTYAILNGDTAQLKKLLLSF